MPGTEGIDLAAMAAGATPAVKAVLAALLAMSVVSWAYIIAGAVRSVVAGRRLARLAAAVEAAGPGPYAGEGAGPGPSAFAEAVRGALSAKPGADPEGRRDRRLKRSLRAAMERDLAALGAGLGALGTIAATAPFIGLFGTVLGVVNAFETVGQTRSATLASVAPGVAEALLATAVGLFAAIPATAAFNYLSGRRDEAGERMELVSVLVRDRLEAGPDDGGGA